MHRQLSKWFFYYPVTLLNGELVSKYLNQYTRTQWWGREDLRTLQGSALGALLLHAARRSRYYATELRDIETRPSAEQSWARHSTLPTIAKQELVHCADDITTTRARAFASKKTTGGSTGVAVTILKNADALARERGATWRSYRWAGVDVGDRQARFWGIPVTRSARFRYHLIDYVANRYRFSAFGVNDQKLKSYHEALMRFRPRYLYGYVSIIKDYIQFIERAGLRLPTSVCSIICTSEVLDASTREYIGSVSAVPVFNEYGCGEVGSIAHECDEGGLHLMEENLIVEIDDGESVSSVPGREGEVIVTDLHNRAMPLLRYRLGDYATISAEPCPCGRGLAVLEGVHGRAYDVVIDPDGRRFHPEVVMYLLEEVKDKFDVVRKFQVIQREPDMLTVKLVTPPEYDGELVEKWLSQRVKDVIHPSMRLAFEYVGDIEREASGKIRLIKGLGV